MIAPVRGRLGLSLLAFGLCACGGTSTVEAVKPTAPASLARGPILHFSYQTLDEKPLSTESVAGRFTLLGFVATYDIASQAETRFLSGLARHHAPRINVALLVLEGDDNRPLVEAFVQTMGLELPVVLVEPSTITGEGPFVGLGQVPSVLLLDREGREVWRHVGLVDERAIERALRAAETAAGVP